MQKQWYRYNIIHRYNTTQNIGLQFLARGLSISHEIRRISWNPPDFTWNPADFTWNPADFMKSLVIVPTLHSSNWRVFAETLAFIILGGFHRWNLGEIHQISWLKSTIFQGEIHQISRVKSPTLHSSNSRVFAETLAFIILGGFDRWNLGEICQISQVKSTRFQGEIHWISRVKSPTLHSSNWKDFAETLAFIILGGFHRWYLGEIHQISWVKSTRFQGEFHEILGHSPHPAFIKLKSFCWNTCFYNFGWISQVKSGWNPPDFMGEICQISGWNPLDFKGEIPHPAFIKLKSFYWNTCFYNLGGFHRWNLGEICQISWVKSTRFKGEIWWIARVKSPTLHSSNSRVFAETLAFIILGGFHRWNLGEIHQISWVKSARFQGEIHWISRVKSPTLHSSNWRVFTETLAFIIWVDFTGEIWVKSARFHG